MVKTINGKKTYDEVCIVCGGGADGIHVVTGHLPGTTPPRKQGQLTYGAVCSPTCATTYRTNQEAKPTDEETLYLW